MTDFGMARDVEQENIYQRKSKVLVSIIAILGTVSQYWPNTDEVINYESCINVDLTTLLSFAVHRRASDQCLALK